MKTPSSNKLLTAFDAARSAKTMPMLADNPPNARTPAPHARKSAPHAPIALTTTSSASLGANARSG